MPALVALLAGLLLSVPALAAPPGAVLVRGNGPDVETLDPHRVRSVSAGNVVRDLYEGLVTENAAGEPVPGLASHWERSADGRRYRFHLRPDLRWSNGEPLTADDVVASLQRSLSPATASPSAALLYGIRQAREVAAGHLPPTALGVSAEDAATVVIELAAPTPYFLALLTNPVAFPVHATLRQAASPPAQPVSSGAYRLRERRLQSHLEVERNPQYWNANAVRIGRVRFVVTEDLNAEFQRFRAGELHLTEQVPAQQIAALAPAERAALRIADYLGVYYLGFNLTRAPFKDAPELRQALSLAIDREVITAKLLGSGEKPAWRWVPPGVAGAPPAPAEPAAGSREARLDAARRLYAQAGYGPARPLRVQIRYNTHEVHQKIATLVAAFWKQRLGVETTLYNEETQVFLQSRRERRLTEVFRASWVADVDDPGSFLDLLRSDNPRNDTGYANPRYDALLDAAAALDGDERRQRFAEAERLMLADAPVIPIYFYVSKHLVAPAVRGWRDNAVDHHYSRDLDLAAP